MLKVYNCKGYQEGASISSKFLNTQQDYECVTFSDGEMEVHFNASVRGDDVFLIQSLTSSDNFVELLLAINAAKLASAKSITAVIPYMGYARQDRKSRPRVSLGAKVIMEAIENAGASRIITMDLHAPQEAGFVNIPVDHLRATSLFIPYLQSWSDDYVLVAPDAGAAKNVNLYAKALGKSMVLCHKHREGINHVDTMDVIGDVKGKRAVIIDDMVDTAGTLCKCASLLKAQGAEHVTAVFTHAVLSGKAVERLSNSDVDQVVTTNTVPLNSKVIKGRFVKLIPIEDLVAAAIKAAFNNDSIEGLFVIKQ